MRHVGSHDVTKSLAMARAHVRCILWYAPNAAKIPQFRLSHAAIDPFTAATASASDEPHYRLKENECERGGNRPFLIFNLLALSPQTLLSLPSQDLVFSAVSYLDYFCQP